MRKSTSLMLSVACVSVAVPVFAQEAPQAAQGAAAENGEIIVTATRRSEALSDVPIAISAVSGEKLQNTGATDIRALNQVAPSLLVSGATSEVNFTARIRGVGTVGENPGLESSVGLFIDGVYRSRTGVGLSELGDIERIEVLRGPQGTLFGRNSTAGLINIVTKGPQFDFGAKGSVTYGNYDYWRVDGSVTGPVSEQLALRLDGVWQKRDGYIKNVTPGAPDINDRDRYLIRGQALFEPSDDISFRLIGDYSNRDENCCGATFQNPVRTLRRSATGTVGFEPNLLFNTLQALGANYQLPSDRDTSFLRSTATTAAFPYRSDTKDWGVSGELNWDLGGAKLASITAYRDYKNAQGQDSDFNALDIIRRTDLQRRFRLFTQELRLQGEAFDGRLDWLIGGYYANEKLDVSDDFKYGNDYNRFANCVIAENFARALNIASLISTADSSCFNRTVAAAVAANPLVPAGTRAQVSGLAGLTPLGAGGFNPAGGFQNVAAAIGFTPPVGTNLLNGTGVVRNEFHQKSRNYAFFTHNKLDIIEDKLSLTLGARYTNERKTLAGTFNTNNTFCTALRASSLQALASLPCVVNGTAGTGLAANDPGRRKSEDEFTGTAVLSFKPIDDLMVYASYSKGYKAGGYNLDTSALDAVCSATFDTGTPATGIPSCATRLARPANTPGNGRPEAADLQFAAEKVDAYEVGFKYDGRGIDVNLAFFMQQYDNYQLNTFNGINFEVTNIQACKDGLAGGDVDGNFSTGGCASDRLRPGVISRGVEIEAFMNPARYFNVNMGLTYSDTYYRRNLVGTNGAPLSPALFQLPGRQISNAPKYVVTGGVAWSPPIGSGGMSGLAYLDFRYQSATNTGSDLDIEKVQDGFLVVNGRLGLYAAEKRWGVEIWGQNLFNRKYQQISADGPLQGGGTYRAVAAPAATALAGTANQLFISFPGEPRTYGITLRGKF